MRWESGKLSRKAAWFLPVAYLLSALICAQAARAQEEGGVPRVTVGEIAGAPAGSLMIPVYFTPDPNRPLRSMVVEIGYTSNSLKFQKALAGSVTEQAGADLEASVTDQPPNDQGMIRSVLRLTVALMERQPQQGLPEGLLVYLLYTIEPDARPFAIRLDASVTSAEDLGDPPQQVASAVTAQDGMVVVEVFDLGPEGTCFFFTH